MLPAIAAGNTIVLKPSELTPLTALLFARAATDAGIPDGVVNVVDGTGPVAGQRLVGHPDVSMVSFTGSTGAGRAVMATAARTVKRVHWNSAARPRSSWLCLGERPHPDHLFRCRAAG